MRGDVRQVVNIAAEHGIKKGQADVIISGIQFAFLSGRGRHELIKDTADLLRTVVESCPTKLLLANPALERSRYAELFQMNEMELDLLADVMPRRQMLLKRPDLTKVLTLTVDPKSYWIYTNTPLDNDRVAAVFREHGFEAGLDRLAVSA